MDLCWINISLDDVQDGDVATLLDTRVDKNVLWVKQSPHYIEHSRLSD